MKAPPIEAYSDDDFRDGPRIVDIEAHRKKRARKYSAALTFDWPEQSSNGPRAKSVANFRAFAASRELRFRFDAMALQLQVQRGKGEPWVPMSDAIEIAEWLRITEHGCDMPNEFWRACAIAEAHRNVIDPGRYYFSKLIWDGQPRLDTLFIRHGGAPDTSLVHGMTRAFFIGAVRRMLKPGCKHDYVLVLDGSQGLGKSLLILGLCPLPEWHCDSLEVGSASKETIEQTAGKFLVELAEMAGMGKREVERVKAFVTRQVDRARLSYGRNAIDVPRRFVCIATVNSDATGQYLGDQTGNRRWWPIEIRQPIDFDALVAERDQIWAEAAHAEAEGGLAYLTADLEREAHAAQEARVFEDPWSDLLSRLTVHRTSITVSEVWTEVAPDKSKRDAHVGRRIANVMLKLGFLKRKIRAEGRTETVFARIDDVESENHDA